MRTSVPRHASIIKERNKVSTTIKECNKVSTTIKECNKVSTASAYYLEQRRARLIVDGISVKTDKTVKKAEAERPKKKAEAERE